MFNIKFVQIGWLFFAVILLVGCGTTTDPPTPTPDAVVDTGAELITTLQAEGVVAQDGGPFSDYLFDGGGQLLLVNGQQVQVWEFATIEDADTAREFISGTESPLATIRFFQSPRFFQAGTMLVLFVNTDPAILNMLTRILGEPFL